MKPIGPRARAAITAAFAAALSCLALDSATGQTAPTPTTPPAAANNVAQILEKHNCAACHGIAGTSNSDDWPNLAGRHPDLIRSELKEFRDGTRAHPLMTRVARALNDAEMDTLASYFAAQRPAAPEAPNTPPVAKDAGRLEEAKNLAGVCMGCHGADGISRKPDWAPNLAGQKRGYLLNQFKAFRDGTRVGEFMPATVHFLKDSDFELLSDYFSQASYPPGFDASTQKTVGTFGKIEKVPQGGGEGGEGLYQYSFSNWHPLFLTTSEGVVLFDPISVPIARDLKRQLAGMGLKVAYVVLTHAHGDHAAGASVFADEAVIISTRGTKETIEKRNAKELIAAKKAGRTAQLEAVPHRTFDKRLDLKVGGTTIELEVPAIHSHSDGDVVFVHLPQHRLLIAADSVSAYVIEFLDFRANPLPSLLPAMQALEKREFDTVTNGHDFIPKAAVVVFREYLEFLTTTIGQAIRDGKTLEEVKAGTQLPEKFIPLALKIYPPGMPEGEKRASLQARFRFNVAGAYEQLKAKAEGREVVDIHVVNGP